MATRLNKVALGQEPADLVIINGNLVNVVTKEIYPAGVAIADERIAAIGDVQYTIGEKTQIIDAEGHYIVPGFVEGHIHPESSCLSIPRFAEIVVSHGTTSVFTDLHEIGVVGGLAAIDAALEEGKHTPLKYHFVVPSHVPFSPGLETSGGKFDADLIIPTLQREDAVGLSEVVITHVNTQHEDLWRSIDATRQAHKTLVGHGPEEKGPAWSAFVAAGIANDHEALDVEDALVRLRNGVYLHLRHNLIVPTFNELIKVITEHHVDTRHISLVTDDTSAIALVKEGHLDYLVRLALAAGIDFATVIQLVTINAAQSYHFDQEIGIVAPGRHADINIVSGPEDFRVLKTVARGKLAAENGHLVQPITIPEHAPVLLNTFHLKRPVTANDLVIPAIGTASAARVHVMRTLPWVPITTGEETTLPVVDGHIGPDVKQDIVHVAVIERHHQTGNVGRAFIGGFGLKQGALASSAAHDNHNIVVIGANPEDAAIAANRVAELNGGIVIVNEGKVLAEIALPLVGLLTDTDAWTLAEQRQTLLDQARALGVTVPEPFMFLSFITLAAIPSFAITDKGYIDVALQQIKDPVLSWS
jgi:adenine deaminase